MNICTHCAARPGVIHLDKFSSSPLHLCYKCAARLIELLAGRLVKEVK